MNCSSINQNSSRLPYLSKAFSMPFRIEFLINVLIIGEVLPLFIWSKSRR